MDDTGKIRSELDINRCLYFETRSDGTINSGHARGRFTSCNANEPYMTFTHNRGLDRLQTDTTPSYCIKQQGNGPDRSDPYFAFDCTDRSYLSNPDREFEYREFECVVDSNNGGDVECCDEIQCGNDCCVDYSCVPRTENNQCIVNPGPTLTTEPPETTPQEIPPCDINDLECCRVDADCPDPNNNGEYSCDSNTQLCLTDPFFLENTIGNKKYCVTFKGSNNIVVGDFVEAGSEECDFNRALGGHLWRRDPYRRYHSVIDPENWCITAMDEHPLGGLDIRIGPCKINQFVLENNGQMKFAGDPNRCIASIQNSQGGRLNGRTCEDLPNFNFTKQEL